MKIMKQFTLLLAFIAIGLICNAQEEKIHWVSIEEAQKLSEENPKKIMIDVYTDWCGPCKMMMRSTFKDPKVIAFVNENYYAVKFNGQGPEDAVFKGRTFSNPRFDIQKGTRTRNSQHQFTAFLGIRGYPTIVFLDENLNKLHKAVGYKPGADFLKVLMATNEKVAIEK